MIPGFAENLWEFAKKEKKKSFVLFCFILFLHTGPANWRLLAILCYSLTSVVINLMFSQKISFVHWNVKRCDLQPQHLFGF